jgi:hypothetical protein
MDTMDTMAIEQRSRPDVNSRSVANADTALYYEVQVWAHQLQGQQQLPSHNNTPLIKMAPKNNKGKAKEPEKAGAAKVKGG